MAKNVCREGHRSFHSHYSLVCNKVSDVNIISIITCICCFRSQAARGKEGIKEGTSEMGTRLDPVPGLPGGKSANTEVWDWCVCVCILK